jgi:nitroreductase
MTVLEAVRRRRSIRAFADQPIEEEKVPSVLDAGRLAPSARSMQEWRFIVVRDRAYEQEAVKQLLGIPPEVQVVCLIPLGYPAGVPERGPRLPLSDIGFPERRRSSSGRAQARLTWYPFGS